MRTCRAIRGRILKDGGTARRSVAAHVAACAGCAAWLAAQQTAEAALRRLDEPVEPAGFQAGLQAALAREAVRVATPGRRRAWPSWRRWAPAAVAVAAVLAIVLALAARRAPGDDPHVGGGSDVGLALRVALAADRAIADAEVALSLPAGVDLAGAVRAASGRELTWRQNLDAGPTELHVGLIVLRAGEHPVVVRVCKDGACATANVVVRANGTDARVVRRESASGGADGLAVCVDEEDRT